MDVTCDGRVGGGCRGLTQGGCAAGAAEAVGECPGWAGCAAFGAFHHQAADGSTWRGRCPGGGQTGWDLVVEAAAYEADGGVDLGGEAGGEGVGEVVGVHASGEPLGGQWFQDGAVGGGEGQSRFESAQLGQGEVRG